jgi:magnesium chelatase subunit H
MAGRLLEANQRGLWQTDAERLQALRDAYDNLEDVIEGVAPAAKAMPGRS